MKRRGGFTHRLAMVVFFLLFNVPNCPTITFPVRGDKIRVCPYKVKLRFEVSGNFQ